MMLFHWRNKKGGTCLKLVRAIFSYQPAGALQDEDLVLKVMLMGWRLPIRLDFKHPHGEEGRAIILTDEDDQSRPDTYPESFQEDIWSESNAAPLDAYADVFLEIKPSYEYMVFGVISGPADTSCTSDFGGASAAPRLHAFLSLTGDFGTWASICEEDLDGAIATILDTIELACDEMPPV